jgi:uncharacterized protein
MDGSFALEHRHQSGGFSKVMLGAILVVACLSPSLDACPLELPTTTVSINGHQLVVEVALSPQAHTCGLSHRSHLPENRGMLFVFSKPALRTFWMKNTWIPLSIAFLDGAGTIINIATMRPDQTDELYHSHRPATYALEVNQGWFTDHGVQTGHVVLMTPPPRQP